MTLRRLFAGLMLMTLWAHYAPAIAAPPTVWPVDPQVKVFRDAAAGTTGPIVLRAARNEYEAGQFALRADGSALQKVRVEITPLAQIDGAGKIAGADVSWNFVGYVPLQHNTPDAGPLCLRKAPCEIPDPLLDAESLDVPQGQTQPVWLTVHVPQDAPPGKYRGTARVISTEGQAELPIELTVDAFTLPAARHLWVTNWFTVNTIANAHKTPLWSEPFWAMLAKYAQNMADHRQNVVYTPWSLIDVHREADGKLSFAYDRFDRFVELFEKAGAAERIEITHIAGFGPVGWDCGRMVLSNFRATERATGKSIDVHGREGIPLLLADLQRHLKERGWLAKSMIHVADEPSLQHTEAWRELSDLVHKAAPELRRIDAIETIALDGALEVWVPKLSHLERWHDAYASRRAGNEFWFYICCHPYGSNYPNRFLDIPTSRVRVLHWLNFADDLAGYLHWGLNFWGGSPFGAPSKNLPPGDTHVLYPGREGPLNSIRWEIERESLEDFEYLHLLTAKTAERYQQLGAKAAGLHANRRAKELCRQVVRSLADAELDPARIMAVRNQIADEILALDQAPLLVAETEPPAGAVLVNGPIGVEVRGVADPGATVKINGKAVTVAPDGRFAKLIFLNNGSHAIVVEAEHNGKQKRTERQFSLMPPPTLPKAAPQPTAKKPRDYVDGLTAKLEPTRTIVYKHVAGRDLHMHIFTPQGFRPSDRRACFLTIHGGGWTGGEPRRMYPFAAHAASLGMVGVSLEYRLMRADPKSTPFECVKDGRSAVRYLRAHAQELGIDPQKIAVSGGSAGGHVAAGTALFDGIDEAGEDISVSAAPNALVLHYAVIDTSTAGYGNAKAGVQWRDISPLHRVQPGVAPTLMFHGTGDTVTPFAGAKAFAEAMHKAGNRCELIVNEGGAHGYLMRTQPLFDETLQKTAAFLTSLGFVPAPATAAP